MTDRRVATECADVSAFYRLETTRKELVDVSSGMRAATNKLETEMGSPTTVAELRDELNTTKQRKTVRNKGNFSI